MDRSFAEVFAGEGRTDAPLEEVAAWAATAPGREALARCVAADAAAVVEGMRLVGDRTGSVVAALAPPQVVAVLAAAARAAKAAAAGAADGDAESTSRLVFCLTLYYNLATDAPQPHHVATLLPLLAVPGAAPLVLMTLVKLARAAPDDTLRHTRAYFDTFATGTGMAARDFGMFATALTQVFAILPAVASQVYMEEDTLRAVLLQVERLLAAEAAAPAEVLLSLISASCISDQCRTFNAQHYLGLLRTAARHEGPRVLATLCIVKIWSFIDGDKGLVDELYLVLAAAVRAPRGDADVAAAVEGLAYLTLNAAVRRRLRQDETAVERLVALVALSDSARVYGLALVFSNLARLPDTTGSLKEFAAGGAGGARGAAGGGAPELPDEVNLFNRSLLVDHAVVAKALAAVAAAPPPSTESAPPPPRASLAVLPQTHTRIITLILLIAAHPAASVRRELVRQGGLHAAFDYLVANSKAAGGQIVAASDDAAVVEARTAAARALARMLVAVDPAQLPLAAAQLVPFVGELLAAALPQDHLEALLALTNLASDTANHAARTAIIGRTFDAVSPLLVATGAVQRAAWQLVANLIGEPLMLARFFNWERPQNRARLELCVALFEATDEALQEAVVGLVAAASAEYAVVALTLVGDGALCREVLERCERLTLAQHANAALMERVVCLLEALVGAGVGAAAKPCLANLFKYNRGDAAVMEGVKAILAAIARGGAASV